MLEFSEDYFDGETKDGFFVRPLMKRYWASCLEMLSDINKVCLKHSIRYFLTEETLLGAIRYHGFAPWSDRIKLYFKRVDYVKFMHFAQRELPKNMYLQPIKVEINECAKVFSNRKISNDAAYMKKNHQFPYVSYIEIEVLDNMPSDSKTVEWLEELWEIGLKLATEWYNPERKFDDNEKWYLIEKFEDLTGQKIDLAQNIPNQLMDMCDKAGAILYDEETERLVNSAGYYGRKEKKVPLPSEIFANVIAVPFENIMVFVPEKYENLLEKQYDNWNEYQKEVDEQYPVFLEQVEIMKGIYAENRVPIPQSYLWEQD